MSEEKMQFESWWASQYAIEPTDGNKGIAKIAYKAALQESEAGAVVLREALAWGRTYGPVLNSKDWEELREQMVVKFAARLAPPYAQAIETAAIMMCVEMCRQLDGEPRKDQDYASAGDCIDSLLALIPQDGRTQLEEFGMKVADKVYGHFGVDPDREQLRSIVTNLIGEKK